MFIVTTVMDVIRIPHAQLSTPTMRALMNEIDQKYPNRVLYDVGFVIGRHGDRLKCGNGVCVAGDGAALHTCSFRLIVFRPFLEEVLMGYITKSTAEGIHVSLGFFQNIFIPAYWMLRPSHYEETSGLWVWTPEYEEEEAEEPKVKVEDDVPAVPTNGNGEGEGEPVKVEEDNDNDNRYEMEIGSEIRFKVKSINFTQVTNTAKGMQATTTTTAATPSNASAIEEGRVRRQRSSSVTDSDAPEQQPPPAMHIVGSICEDGLGLTNWWTNAPEEEEEED
jgi:DNA-directed RNA polymerase III subunit RPC8